MKYRKKGVIEAIEWKGYNFEEVRSYFNFAPEIERGNNEDEIRLKVDNYWTVCDIGDFIVRGEKGEFYPCDAQIFKEQYEPIL